MQSSFVKVKPSSILIYHKVVSSNMSRLEANADFFRLPMKGSFDPFDKKLISLN